MTIPILTIVHSLPDRVRLHFSIPPVNFEDIRQQLLQDKRIMRLDYSGISHTCVICYNHKKVELLHILKLITIALGDEIGRASL